MGFWEHKTELVCFLSITEGTEVIVNLIDDDVWESKHSITSALIDVFYSWDWLCL